MYPSFFKAIVALCILFLASSLVAIIVGNNFPAVEVSATSQYLPEWLGYSPISETQTCLFLKRDSSWLVRCIKLNLPDGVYGWMQVGDYLPCEISQDNSWDCEVSWNEEQYGKVFTCSVWTGVRDEILYLITNCQIATHQPIIFTYPLGYYLGP